VSKVDLEALASLLSAVEAGDSSVAAAAWLGAEAGSLDHLSEADCILAVEAARRMGLVQHLQAAKTSPMKVVRKAAAKAIHALTAAGAEVPQTPKQPGGWSLGSEQRELPPPVGLIGLPQGDGYFPFILLTFARDAACVCAGVAGSGQGFQDADHAHVGRSRAKAILSDARRDHNLVEVPFHVALSFCQRAFEEGGRGEPGGWSHMLSSVPEGVQNAARMLDPLAKQDADLDSDALHQIDTLLDGPRRIVFNLEERISGPAVDAVMGALTSTLAINDDEKRRRVADEVMTATNQAFDGHARKTWTLAMDVLTAISEVAGWREEQRAARHISLALQAGRPGADIPFFRIWSERQLAAVSEMIMAVRENKPQ
jgi:hypothetical protein